MVADKNPCLCSHAAVVHSLSRGQQKRDRHADSPSPTLGSPLVSPGVPGYGDADRSTPGVWAVSLFEAEVAVRSV
jgi:hypothetical protein